MGLDDSLYVETVCQLVRQDMGSGCESDVIGKSEEVIETKDRIRKK